MVISLLCSLFVLHPAWADDTEIFFNSAAKSENQPNILFVLDASGSMAFYDCENGRTSWGSTCNDDTPNGNTSRMDRMMTAMRQVIQQARNVNIGLMRFGGTDGGRIIYPVRDIDGNRCAEEVCDETTIFDASGTVRSTVDHAIEIETGEVVSTMPQLSLAVGNDGTGSSNIDPLRVEAETGSLSGGARTHTRDGIGMVGWIGRGSVVSLPVNVMSAGAYSLNTRFATPYNNRRISLYVNNTKVHQLGLEKTGGWFNWENDFVDINLNAGTNTVEYRVDSGDTGAINIDYIELSPSSGTEPELAQGQSTLQSSTAYNGVASRAVDGNESGRYNDGSVTHTATENDPWWQVDLTQNHQLSKVQIWNRTDCCSNRLANFHIFVSYQDMRNRSLDDLLADTGVWSYHHAPAVAANGNLEVNTPATGRFVRIQKAERGILSLAEVKVYGVGNGRPTAALSGAITAVRFQNLGIPQGATIVDASVLFTSPTDQNTSTDLTIRVEDVANAESFTNSTTNSISNRQWHATSTYWSNVEAWSEGDTHESTDISELVQHIVNKQDWCGGNAMSLSFNGEGNRMAQTFESGNPPVLKVRYRMAGIPDTGGCTLSTSSFYMDAFNDDINEYPGGTISGKADPVSITNDSLAGVQFDGVIIPQGAKVRKATIEFTTIRVNQNQNTGTDLQARVSMDDRTNPEPLSTNTFNLSSRSKTSTLDWQIPLPVNSSRVVTRDLSPLVNDMVAKADWEEGNRMVFLFEKNGGSAQSRRTMDRYENTHHRGGVLTISYETFRTTASEIATGGVRADLTRMLDEFVMLDGTSTIGALEESWRYFAGKSVNHGKRRTETIFNEARRSRVSHPESYTGGELVRNAACHDDNLNSYSCETEAIKGNPVYVSPTVSECQPSHVVLVTDGKPGFRGTREYFDKTLSTLTTLAGGSCSDEYGYWARCGIELAEYMHTTDLDPDLGGDQNLILHTIGYNHYSDWLKNLATTGGGDYLTAASSEDLFNAVSGVVTNVANAGTTFVAPTATIDQFSRLAHRKDVYLALFQPQPTANWQGNLKRYDISGSPPGIKDANGEFAINPDTGSFKSSAKSFWSADTDGGTIELGGAAEQLEPITRNVVTHLDPDNTDLLSAGNRISNDNTLITEDMFDARSEAELNQLIDWLTGFDVNDDNNDGNTSDTRNHIGDPLHSKPVVITYSDTDGEPADPDNSDSVVYFGTNEGFLHAINTSDGVEKFAFMPSDLFSNVTTLFSDYPLARGQSKPYGLDGDITLWLQDTNNNGIVEHNSGEKAYLYIGMRRGGKNYYALDVSDKNNPKFLWSIKGGTGDFSELAQSWSKPIVSSIKVEDKVRKVLVFGGGYDPLQDNRTTRTPDTIGRAIFIVDAESGKLIWSGLPADAQSTSTDAHQELFSEMLYSIPSDLTIVEEPRDKQISQIYVGDMGGRIWRFDVNNGASLEDLVEGGVITDFGEDNNPAGARRFYHPPDLSLSRLDRGRSYNIVIGSGYQAHPLNKTIEDRLYTFRYPVRQSDPAKYGIKDPDYDTYEHITIDELYDATENVIGQGSAQEVDIEKGKLARKIGWYIKMEQGGEKILGKSSTFNSVVRFISYVPSQSTEPCDPSLGKSYYWSVNLVDGTPFDPDGDREEPLEKEDRKEEVPGEGLAAPVTTIFVDEEDGDVNVIDMSGLNTVREWGDVQLLRRVYWSEYPDF